MRVLQTKNTEIPEKREDVVMTAIAEIKWKCLWVDGWRKWADGPSITGFAVVEFEIQTNKVFKNQNLCGLRFMN
ncbi:hypothetical protein B9Z55_019350 [Caenorhabditis nigoni]|uniref:Uncharacterized protein n=1 Tax=Caenorhabditis nigoni TaxID=1611254 RepID=A0A2G5TIU0_9PELO|nr:hypothetical protein B9Z55_019350 [Caenorhabditis nigoni]